MKPRNAEDKFENRLAQVPVYSDLHESSEHIDLLKSSSGQGNEIWGMMRTQPGNCTPILAGSKDDGKTAAETDSDEIVTWEVRSLC